MKRKILVDIKGGRDLARRASRPSVRVNLDKRRDIEIFLVRALKIFVIGFAVVFFFFNIVRAPSEGARAAQNVTQADAQRKALEAQLADLERQIVEQESIVSRYRAQGVTLSQEIRRINARIAKLNLEIRAARLSLLQLDNQITETRSQIAQTESEIEKNKENLARILRTLYENDTKSLVEILLTNPSISVFFGNMSNLIIVQDNMRAALQTIVQLKVDLVTQREKLALERADVEALQQYQLAQRSNVAKTQEEKSTLLAETRGKESEYRRMLETTRKTASEVRKQIFRLFDGGEMSFEEAYRLAKFASGATGVDAAFILAILDQESALGRNVGRCSYQTAMHPRRDIPIFREIIDELRRNRIFVPDPLLVSCPIHADGAFGGAMGPAQFIPSTWRMYASSISAVTGNNPPSPWRNTDAFAATALYLRNAYNSNACIEYSRIIPSEADMLRKRCAAAQYYAGSRWHRFRFAYGNPVLERARRFAQDIAILEANQ